MAPSPAELLEQAVTQIGPILQSPLTHVRHGQLLAIVARDNDLATVQRQSGRVPTQSVGVGEVDPCHVSLLPSITTVLSNSRDSLAFAWLQRKVSGNRDLNWKTGGSQLGEALDPLLASPRLDEWVPSEHLHASSIFVRELVADIFVAVVGDGNIVVAAEEVSVVESNLLKGETGSVADNLEGIYQPVADLRDGCGEAVVSGGAIGPGERCAAGDDALVQRLGEALA